MPITPEFGSAARRQRVHCSPAPPCSALVRFAPPSTGMIGASSKGGTPRWVDGRPETRPLLKERCMRSRSPFTWSTRREPGRN